MRPHPALCACTPTLRYGRRCVLDRRAAASTMPTTGPLNGDSPPIESRLLMKISSTRRTAVLPRRRHRHGAGLCRLTGLPNHLRGHDTTHQHGHTFGDCRCLVHFSITGCAGITALACCQSAVHAKYAWLTASTALRLLITVALILFAGCDRPLSLQLAVVTALIGDTLDHHHATGRRPYQNFGDDPTSFFMT